MVIEELDDKSRLNLRELIDYIRKGQCCAFVGAGLSKPAGYPLWEELLDKLKKVAENITGNKAIYNGTGFEPAEKADSYRKIIGEEKYYEFLIDTFDPTDNKQPCLQVHHDLIQMPFNAYVTTNYDCLLKRALEEEGKNISYDLYPFLDVTRLREKRLFHIHGIIDYDDLEKTKKSIILTKSDFKEAYNSKSSNLVTFLKTLYSSFTIMFIGFSLNEFYFKEILKVSKLEYERMRDFAEVRNIGRLTEPKHYAFLPSIEIKTDNLTHEQIKSIKKSRTEIEDSELQALGVSTIRYNADEFNHTQLINLISEMKHIVNGTVQTKITRDNAHWSE